MKYKKLGSTDVEISSIGLGTNFTHYKAGRDDELVYLLQKALDLGINFFDSAEIYLNGNSERLIGKAFNKSRDKVFISTKVAPENCSYEKMLKACEASLKRLHTDYIDLYQIHWPNPLVSPEETIKGLEKLVTQGKVKNIGVSNFSLRQFKNIQKVSRIPLVSMQAEYNLLERSAEIDLLPFCEKKDITFTAYTPLNSGNILTTEKYSSIFFDLSKKYNKSTSQIILNFLTAHQAVVAIPATTSKIHLAENAESTNFVLEEKDIKIIQKIFTTKIINIDTKKIKIANISRQQAYKTINEALANKLNFFPSPKMLSEDIQKGDFLKPVKVRAMQKKDGVFEYELLGGRIRYWAWVIAYNDKKPIPAIIED